MLIQQNPVESVINKNEKFLLTQANDVLKLVEKFSCEKSAKTEIKIKLKRLLSYLKSIRLCLHGIKY